MAYFDVIYKSPSGIVGQHTAVEAYDAKEAAYKSPVYLTYSSLFKPEDYTVLSVNPSENVPTKNQGS
jgi:hypothetical protein